MEELKLKGEMLKDEMLKNEKLLTELQKLKKINAALMNRVERSVAASGNSFALFEGNILLSKQVKTRTEDLQTLTKNISLEKERIKDILNLLPGEIVIFNEMGKVDQQHSKWSLGNLNDDIFHCFGEQFQFHLKNVLQEISVRPRGYFEFKYINEQSSKDLHFGTWFIKGSEKQMILYLQDFTDHVEQEKIIKMQEVQMINASRLSSLGQMAGGVAHEINNPLTIISGNASIALARVRNFNVEESLKKKVCDSLEKISDTVLRISKIVSGLRTIARDTGGESFTSCSIGKIVGDVISLSSEKFKANGVGLELHLHREDVEIMGDQVQLSQVLINLLNNSFFVAKSMTRGWIRVFSCEHQEKLRIYVVDCGRGIEEHILQRIFDPFFTTKEIGEGTLGMSISAQIMQTHGGVLEYELVGGNTGFYLELPMLVDNKGVEGAK